MASKLKEIAEGVHWLPVSIANVYFVRSGSGWVLIDTSIPNRGQAIRAAAEELSDAPPAAILLTHGHMDHSGSAVELARVWKAPVYVDQAELEFLDGTKTYPPPDPSVGGFMAFMSRLFPLRKLNLEGVPQPFEDGQAIPGLADWESIATPGHSPGHVSFYRRSDRTLIVGDACVTMDLDSFWAIVTKRQEISRPPAPITCNWKAARRSVEALAALEPRVLACGHGIPMTGSDTAQKLRAFSEHFPTPIRGRYV